MYSGRGFREWEIGDIDVVVDNGVYHLFHLILPNHDYIAHAVSTDCINWERVKNAIFVGDPGEWDDDMLWTMNVVKRGDGHFEMFYTGLSQREKGHLQRIGKAVSSDLMTWTKVEEAPYPLEPAWPHYESKTDNLRKWVSFRDPFYFKENETEYLLMCARTNKGCMSRRGCVGVARIEGDQASLEKPLFTPYVYDDIECPCLIPIQDRYYLIGSIREDVKVHYWFSDSFQGQYHAFHDNVLMPQGNYAARVTRDGDRLLLYSFYVTGENVETASRFLPPPKELVAEPDGTLALRSFYRWEEKVKNELDQDDFPPFHSIFHNPTASHQVEANGKRDVFKSSSGYEIFSFTNPHRNYMWSGKFRVTGLGKCGLVFDGDRNGDGYYISLDVKQGFAQIRAWGGDPNNLYRDYLYVNLQTNNFIPSAKLDYDFKLIRYGHYIEFSVDERVALTLVDSRFSGDQVGFYCESAEITLTQGNLKLLNAPPSEDELNPYGDE